MRELNFEAKGDYLIAQEGTKVWRIEPLAWAYLEFQDLADRSGKFQQVGQFNEIQQAIETAEGME